MVMLVSAFSRFDSETELEYIYITYLQKKFAIKKTRRKQELRYPQHSRRHASCPTYIHSVRKICTLITDNIRKAFMIQFIESE